MLYRTHKASDFFTYNVQHIVNNKSKEIKDCNGKTCREFRNWSTMILLLDSSATSHKYTAYIHTHIIYYVHQDKRRA